MNTVENYNVNLLNVAGVEGTPGQSAPTVGIVQGVKYYRKYTKNGVPHPAHVEFTGMANRRYRDNAGNQKEESGAIRFEAWNSRDDDGSGKGLADIVAKWYSVGKSFSVSGCIIRRYMRKVYLRDGSIVNNTDGQPILVPATSVLIRHSSSLIPHNEGGKTIAREITNYLGGMTQQSFHSRPPNWNIAGHPDAEIWKQLITWRSAQKYTGGDVYGHGKVLLLEGAQPNDGFPVHTPGAVAIAQPGIVNTVMTDAQTIAVNAAVKAALAAAGVTPPVTVSATAEAAPVVGDDIPY